MRKITKQNLKELAKIMPVIDEKAQREYFGGSWYVNRHTGDEYGKVGTDDVIRTTDDFGYGKAKDDNSENEGMPLQGCDNSEKDIVFAAYAKRTIEYFGKVRAVDNYYDKRPMYVDSGVLYVNVQTSSGYWGLRNALIDNLRAIRSSIEASGNLSGGISGGISGTWADKESELDRELHKLNTNGVPYSNDAEQAQRSNLAERYFELWKAMGDYNNGHHYLHDAYRMCKVIGYYTSTVPVGTDD